MSDSHDDFAAIVAEAINVIAKADYDFKFASEQLACSSSQLIKLLRQTPRGLAFVNQMRNERGLGKLK